MNILLDTNVFIWWAQEPELLPEQVVTLCENPENDLYLSTVSATEIAIKFQKRKLYIPSHPSTFVPQERGEHHIQSLPLDESSALLLESLPPHHKDPFDRLLVCQALAHDLTILTPDPNFRKYKVKVAW